MPIYAYRCDDCGHEKDVLQKFSDAPLTACPACGASTFRKKVTAPAFQLKGTGWYVTDFRGGGKPGAAPAGEGGKEGGGQGGGGQGGEGTGSGSSGTDKPGSSSASGSASASGDGTSGGGKPDAAGGTRVA